MYRVPPAAADTAGADPPVEAGCAEQAVATTMTLRLTTTAANPLTRIWW
jgi:hypothetical protein